MTAPGRPFRTAPNATYRLQITAEFSLDDAVGVVDHLAGLGVSHAYLSPLLTAAPGSTHGYDVVDHASIDTSRGGESGLRRLADALHDRGLGIVLDIVPNHMSVAVPPVNAAWWDLLTFGQDSAYARWFDVEWETGPVLVPVLGGDDDIDRLELVDGAEGPELAYYDHRFPVAPGTDTGTPQDVHARQHYRLTGWRQASTDLNYRRFFDVTTLAGLRVEDPEVYARTHELILRLVADGVVDGLRIDHPDGLADPGGYLRRLARDANSAWIVVEKILEPGEVLPGSWPVAGTTGYDAARLVTGAFVDPAGAPALQDLYAATGRPVDFAPLVVEGKRQAATGLLAAETARLARLAPDVPEAGEALAEVMVALPVYRSYLPGDGIDGLRDALAQAATARPDLAEALDRLTPRLTDSADPLCVRLQQTSGMVMAKGVEDTAFYRHHVLLALSEVGSDPAHFGVPAEEWHTFCQHLQTHWPATMTLLSSHDTKRSEDVRARLVLLSQLPEVWAAAVERLAEAAGPYTGRVAPDDAYLLHQTLAGTGPIDAERVGDYLRKATREAKLHTSWIDADEAYDADLQSLVRAVLGDTDYLAALEELLATLDRPWQRTVVAQKLLQLTMPGVPDLYQGSERLLISLVDPDNRRPVDFTAPDDAKTAMVRTVLQLRRDSPQLFSSYTPLEAGPYALAYSRSSDLHVVVVTRPVAVDRNGWGETILALPTGDWRDALTGGDVTSLRLADLVGERPGVVLIRS